MTAYYNEIDPYAAQWLRNLISAGRIAPGDVDERSVIDVRPEDLIGYTQCHFFAGIGGWSVALRLAGWDDSRPVWTGSCPCQPFSVAGKGKAQSDERHLWPAWFNLIKSVKPPVVFGEQVAGAIAHGWLDDAFDDLEGQDYETAAAVLPACSVGAPHKRDRLWFVGISRREGWQSGQSTGAATGHRDSIITASGNAAVMANSESHRRDKRDSNIGGSAEGIAPREKYGFRDGGDVMANTIGQRGCSRLGERENAENAGQPSRREEHGFWEFEPPLGRVADGIPARSHKLRAYGNAIVPQVAAEFIKAATTQLSVRLG